MRPKFLCFISRSRLVLITALLGAFFFAQYADNDVAAQTGEPEPAPDPGAAAPAAEPAAVAAGYTLEQASYAPGMSQAMGITGHRADGEIAVKVLRDGEPAAGERVDFRLLSIPSKSEGAALSRTHATSGSDGIAKVDLTLGSKAGTYLVGAYLHSGLLDAEPVTTRVQALTPGWIAFLIFGLLGGLGLFIFGMNMAGNNLQKVAGNQMRTILGKLARNRVAAVLVGTLASGVLQSSSATTVLLVGFVSATMMTLTQAIGATMGAKIGTTITVQLIAFNISQYSLAIIALGFIIMMAGGKKKAKQVGSIILGFGLIFFGMSVMSKAMGPLRGMPEFAGLLVEFSDSPALSIVAGTVFTAIIQSSAATIGLALALASQKLLNLDGALALSLGAAVGTCATALLASLGGSREGKQVAVAHLLYSALAVIICYPFLGYFIDLTIWVTALLGSHGVERQLANGFMLFAILSAVVFLPFLGPFEKLVRLIVPLKKGGEAFGPQFINEGALSVPLLALEQAKKEVERMAEIFRQTFGRAIEVIEGGKEDEILSLIKEDDKLDTLEKAIRPFLVEVAQRELTEEAVATERALIFITEHFEGAGDILAKEILHVGEKMAQANSHFSPEGLEELKNFHGKIMTILEKVQAALATNDHAMAEQVLQLSFKEAMMERRLRESHLERLHSGGADTVDTSSGHLTILAGLHDIGQRLAKIADEIIQGT